MTEAQHPLLRVSDLQVRFKGARSRGALRRPVVRAVDGVSLHIEAGETVGLVGESGSGKSTTARAVVALAPVYAGLIAFQGVEVGSTGARGRRDLRARTQMVFQDPFGSLNPRMSVGDIIREPLEIHRVGDRAARRARVAELLKLVGLPDDADRRHPHEFSGGQRQRIGIARALAVEPSLVVLDEPVAALDISIQAQILQLLKELQRKTGVAYLFIAHDLNVVQHVARRSAVMYLGRIVEEGPSRALFTRPRHPYTQALVSAIPVPDPDAPRRRQVLHGEIPSPTNPPSGCRFRTRCPHARERCAVDDPALEPAENGVSVACHFWREIRAAAGDDNPPAQRVQHVQEERDVRHDQPDS